MPPTPTATEPLLSVRDLRVSFALDQVLGVVGESGCGKSVTMRAILQLVDKPGRITSGTIRFRRRDTNEPVDQLQDRLHGDALAAARFADHAQHLAGHDVEAGAVDGADQPLVEGEGDAQVAHREQGLSGYRGQRHRAVHRLRG